ncbi:MAG: HNH endonuclease [Erysipelotrichaceae bacterium]|nr:HNH endonuclease [Erysipelotrichaceae bacterium]
MSRNRPDKDGKHQTQFNKNKKKIYATQTVCGICGLPVDPTLKYPHPLSRCIDHIVPIAKGGHPSDISNLQLAHWICNREKSDKLLRPIQVKEQEAVGINTLPLTVDWKRYRSSKEETLIN